jgi:hypothetical protein
MIRQLTSWLAFFTAIGSITFYFTLKNTSPYPYAGTAYPVRPVWMLQGLDICMYITFFASLLSLPKWQSFFGIGSLLLIILFMQGA